MKSGIKQIDDNLTITSKGKLFQMGLLTNGFVEDFLNLEKYVHPLKLRVEYDFLPLIKELKGKMVIGIETNYWLDEETKVDKLLEIGEEIVTQIRNASARHLAFNR